MRSSIKNLSIIQRFDVSNLANSVNSLAVNLVPCNLKKEQNNNKKTLFALTLEGCVKSASQIRTCQKVLSRIVSNLHQSAGNLFEAETM